MTNINFKRKVLATAAALALIVAPVLAASPALPASAVTGTTISTTGSDVQGFTMSPMKQKIVMSPGDTYENSLKVSNPGTNQSDINYTITVEPFYVDENYNSIFNEDGMSYNQIVQWITIDSPTTGTIAPNAAVEIHYTINVPSDAPAGGQYAAIIATATTDDTTTGMSIKEHQAIAHTLFAEITGRTVRQGEILDASLPSFLFSGAISGKSTIKNTGNVHGTATYTLTISSLFGGATVYTNADEPETRTIVPDRTLVSEVSWPATPPIGIFNATYTVQFEGVTKEISKLVIICPLYLLILIIAVVVGLVAWLIYRTKHSPKRQMR